MKNNDRI